MQDIKQITRRIIIIALLAILVLLGAGLFTIYTDYIEIKEIGEQFTSVFFKDMFVKIASWGISFFVVFVFTLINLLVLRKVMLNIDVTFEKMKYLPGYFLLAFVIAFFGSGYIKEEIYSL